MLSKKFTLFNSIKQSTLSSEIGPLIFLRAIAYGYNSKQNYRRKEMERIEPYNSIFIHTAVLQFTHFFGNILSGFMA